MSRRYLVFGLSAVLALSLAVPALGGPSNPIASTSASAKSIALKALRVAKNARRKANNAQSTANNAQSTANSAKTDAANAQTSAEGAQATADSAAAAASAAQASANSANANANSRLISTNLVAGPTSANNGTSPKSDLVLCAAGDRATGGGYIIGGTDSDDEAVDASFSYGDSWFISAQELQGTTPGNWTLQVYVQCASN